MKKRFKMLDKNGHLFILNLETDGVLFGPMWKTIAYFTSTKGNIDRCRNIVRLLNECDRHTES